MNRFCRLCGCILYGGGTALPSPNKCQTGKHNFTGYDAVSLVACSFCGDTMNSVGTYTISSLSSCNQGTHNFTIARVVPPPSAPSPPAPLPPPTLNFQVATVHPSSITNLAEWICTEYNDVNHPIPLGNKSILSDPLVSVLSNVNNTLTTCMNAWIELDCGDGEYSQIARNDGLFRTVLILSNLPSSNFSRNIPLHSIVGTPHPDFTAKFNGVPLFFAEEKEGDDIVNARSDILRKFAWIPHYHQLPFFVTFAVCFTFFEINILQRGETQPIRQIYPISTLLDRFKVLKIIINMFSVFKCIVETQLIPPSLYPFGKRIQRPLGKDFRLGFKGAEVKIRVRDGIDTDQAEEWFLELNNFYQACKAIPATEYQEALPAVPNIEFLDPSVHQNPVIDSRHFFLKPIGVAIRPTTLYQLCEAMICVVKAIWAIHSRHWLHTDIRWENVVKQDTDPATNMTNWFVIDCYRACRPNSQRALDRGSEETGNQQANFSSPRYWTYDDDRAQVRDLMRLNPYEISALFTQVRTSIFNNDSLQIIINQLNAIKSTNPNTEIEII